MRSPEFEAMIGPAKLYPQLWRLFLGLLLIAFCYLGLLALQAVALFMAVGPMEYFGTLQSLAFPDAPLPTILLLATFGGLLLGPVVAAGTCHFRGPSTLLGPRDELFRGFFTVLVVAVPLYVLVLTLGALAEPPRENLSWAVWASWLPLAVPLIFVQIAAEELVFRGYLQQQLAARFAARWIWMGVPSVLFASLHWNPAAGGAVWLILLATFVFALIAADLTERTGSLGAALGLHFVNNAFGILAISVSGTITGLARWVTPFEVGAAGPLVLSLGFNIAFLVVLWRLLVRILDR